MVSKRSLFGNLAGGGLVIAMATNERRKSDHSSRAAKTKVFRTRLNLLTCVFFLFSCVNAYAETYYVDSGEGSDKNNGTTEMDAWQSLERVNAATFSPGDRILFKRGMQWRGKLIVPSSGSEALPITFGAYGTGDNPVIMRTVRFSEWEPADNGGNAERRAKVWVGSLTMLRGSWGMVVDGTSTPIHRPESRFGIATDTMKDGHYYSPANSGLFYYRNDSGRPGAVEIGAYDEAIQIVNKKYVTIDGIDTFGPGGIQKQSSGSAKEQNYKSIAISKNSTDITIKNLSVSHANSIGLWSDPTTSNIVYDKVSAHHNGGTGIYMNSNGGKITNCRSFENGRLENGRGDRGGIGSFKGSNITIEQNEVFLNGPDDGNADFEVSIVRTGPVKILRNYIHDCLQGCVQIAEAGDGSMIAYNVISRYGTAKAANLSAGKLSGIRIGGGLGGARNIQIYNNVLHGGRQAADSANAALFVAPFDNSGLRVANNIFVDNDNKQAVIANGKNATPDQVQFTNNLFSSLQTGVQWKGSLIRTMDYLQIISRLGAGSLVGAPMFSNASGMFSDAADFRLKGASPAVNRGINLGLVRDYDGKTVPIGVAPDIGAFELQVSE